eukprot:gene10330-biopygen6278
MGRPTWSARAEWADRLGRLGMGRPTWSARAEWADRLGRLGLNGPTDLVGQGWMGQPTWSARAGGPVPRYVWACPATDTTAAGRAAAGRALQPGFRDPKRPQPRPAGRKREALADHDVSRLVEFFSVRNELPSNDGLCKTKCHGTQAGTKSETESVNGFRSFVRTETNEAQHRPQPRPPPPLQLAKCTRPTGESRPCMLRMGESRRGGVEIAFERLMRGTGRQWIKGRGIYRQ